MRFRTLLFVFCFLLLSYVTFTSTNASSFFADNFDRSDSTNIGDSWVEDSGDWIIDSGQLVAPVADDSILHNLNAPSSADYYVQAQGSSSEAFTDTPDIVARFVDINNYYMFQSDGTQCTLYKKIQGNWTLLDNQPFTRSANTFNTYRLEVAGNQIKGFIDNQLIVSAIDSSISEKGFGGLRRGGSLVKITFDNFEIGDVYTPTTAPSPTETPTPSPSPTETPTQTPTPTPSSTPTPTATLTPTATPIPTSIPVKKVIFAPGFGGSWNADAIVNCKTDNFNGSWTLAPFAKDIYTPLFSALTSAGWQVEPFYYDYRQDVRNNAASVSQFINSNTQEGEKVNFVGHSMGGLVGRAYMESLNGGKFSSYLSVGTPHQGVPLIYPLLSGQEIWNENLVEKIAETLIVKRCGIPNSPKNLLPTFDYLKDDSTHQLKPVSSLTLKNNWLPTNFIAPFYGVRVGTLSGTGFPTLKIIDVVNASKSDIKNGNWADGKPVGQEFVKQGDGTVLVSSSQLPGSQFSDVINQTHTGLVASTQGISEILKFLGSPPPQDPAFVEPKSALVIVGYPGNFWIKDKNGNVINSEEGVISIINPADQDYQLQVIPQSSNTLLITSQFLPNGNAFYKEYHLTGVQPQTRIIEFSSKHPREDILKENKYKEPKYFDWFRNFWDWFRNRR